MVKMKKHILYIALGLLALIAIITTVLAIGGVVTLPVIGQHCGDDGNQGQEAQCDIQDMFFHFDHDVPLPRRRAALLLSLLCEWAKPLGG